ncbi:hypothetical protein C7B64_12725 [Merismopedia glauca CCAP 1448/3]|uniref:Armadillo-type fold-containing protein n=1 Tax=Merismopedia glauca CCAP 1448/3 TaxID=1296344 RepID=A0A2T1C2P5_9CYAN|nr:hypothetical protein C7B64_12725 [Merismopedia glauca CCAP 1448/3]
MWTQFESKSLQQLSAIRLKKAGKWLLSLTLVLALLFWNWQLWLATAVGVAVMLLVYLIPEWNGHLPLTQVRKWLTGVHRQLVLAVGSGGIAALSTYMAVITWRASDSPWLASGAILQGIGTLSVLVLLLWLIFSRQAAGEETKLHQMLIDLTDSNPLKRMVAVGYIGKQIADSKLERQLRHQLINYLCVMLTQESEPLVKNAVMEVLKKSDPSNLKPINPPLKISINQQVAIDAVPLQIPQEERV